MGSVKVKIQEIQDLKVFSGKEEKEFKVQSVIVKTGGDYPQELSIDFLQDKIGMLNNLKIGDVVEMSYNLKGRKWKNPNGEVRYFTTLACWKIDKAEQEVSVSDQSPGRETEEDLPF
tara:strand:- start:615 stop:965 length:351 start_codon:yes stop_codon:yes gene_type:complete